MKEITIKEFKKKWIEFNNHTGHVEIINASVVPSEETGALFTVAGMHPLVPYLLGKKHPQGVRLANSQRCIRTNDIDSVGDDTHCTFFEMLGTWSLGDYFKEKAIKDSYEFLTSPNYLNLPLNKIAVTVFEGDENAPRDNESYEIWKNCGLSNEQIFFLGKDDNWWAMGEVGPCGPDTEMFYVTDKDYVNKKLTPANSKVFVEIGNNVFMQYVVNNAGEKPISLPSKNVDRGMGLERLVMVLNGYKSVYELDVFRGSLNLIKALANKPYDDTTKKAYRVICEHLRTATIILGDNTVTVPSNVGRGYILRRLIRRAVRYAREIELNFENLQKIVEYYIDYYKEDFPEFVKNKSFIISELNAEIEKFNHTLVLGIKEFEKVMTYVKDGVLPGKTAFRLYDTFGFPLEITKELAQENGFSVDEIGYYEAYKKHQETSKGNVEAGEFKGGLADHSYETTKYHTATHLTLAALRKIFGEDVYQKGSNLTSERMRLDFNLDRKMTDEEIKQVEDIVNEKIKESIPVVKEEMTVEQAKESGAVGVFESKYGEVVSVYTIGNFSKEICGGPHVNNTSELGKYKIEKEQSSSSGVRRIKAILES